MFARGRTHPLHGRVVVWFAASLEKAKMTTTGIIETKVLAQLKVARAHPTSGNFFLLLFFFFWKGANGEAGRERKERS